MLSSSSIFSSLSSYAPQFFSYLSTQLSFPFPLFSHFCMTCNKKRLRILLLFIQKTNNKQTILKILNFPSHPQKVAWHSHMSTFQICPKVIETKSLNHGGNLGTALLLGPNSIHYTYHNI